jgi:hypothetical protein
VKKYGPFSKTCYLSFALVNIVINILIYVCMYVCVLFRELTCSMSDTRIHMSRVLDAITSCINIL